MGLGITFVLVLLAFNANCDENLDSLVNDALTAVNNKANEVNETINENLKVQKNLQTTLRSLESNLSDSLVGTYLADYVNNLESLHQFLIETNETTCFTGRKYVLDYIKEQTNIYYKICVSRFSKTTTEDELKLVNLQRAAATTTTSLRACENNANFRKNLAFGRLCVDTAKDSFDALIKTLNTSPVNEINYPDEVSKCITNTVNRAEDIIESLNDVVVDCITKVSDNDEFIKLLPELLPNPVSTQDVFQPQTVVPIGEELRNLAFSIENKLAELKVLLESAAAAKNTAQNNGTLALLYFTEVNSKLAEEAVKFGSTDAAKSCVANFQSLLTSNKDNRVVQLKNCVSSAANPNFDDVKLIESNFQIIKALDKNTILNCLANIDNIFPIGGIQNCIEDKRKDDEIIFQELELRLEELKLETELIEKRVVSCTTIASDTGKRQLARDIASFETCIKRNTGNNNYKFP